MRTKARDGFVKALRAAHRWLDELLSDPNTSADSLAVREGKSERSIRMTPALCGGVEGRDYRRLCFFG